VALARDAGKILAVPGCASQAFWLLIVYVGCLDPPGHSCCHRYTLGSRLVKSKVIGVDVV